MQQWFIRFGSDAVGPLTSAELRQLARDGGLSSDSQLSKDGITWFRADALQNLKLQAHRQSQSTVAIASKPQSPQPESKKSNDFFNTWPWWLLSGMLLLGRFAYVQLQKHLPPRPRPVAAQPAKQAPAAAPNPEQLMAAATRQYWTDCARLIRNALTAATAQKNFALMEPYLRRIENLPVTNVDPAVLPVVLELTASLRDSAQVNARSQDPVLFLEILARSSQGEQFKPGLQIREEAMRVQKRIQAASASAIQMRALLSQHYGVEFPPLVD